MIELIVFDFNGTILADTQACVDSGNHVIKTFGGIPLPRKEYIKKFYFPVLEFYCDQGCDRKAIFDTKNSSAFHDYYNQRSKFCRPRKYCKEILEFLKNKSINSIILSNDIEENINFQLSRLELKDYFSEFLGNTSHHESNKGLCKIDRMKKYFQDNDIDPKKSFIVGDSPEDVSIGKELGMTTIALYGGIFDRKRLRETKADYYINNLREIIGIINKNN